MSSSRIVNLLYPFRWWIAALCSLTVHFVITVIIESPKTQMTQPVDEGMNHTSYSFSIQMHDIPMHKERVPLLNHQRLKGESDGHLSFDLTDLSVSETAPHARQETPSATTKYKNDWKVGATTDITQLQPRADYILIYLYDYIASNIRYPESLRKRKIDGHVKVLLVFDKSGNYLKDQTHLKSNSNYLKVLVGRTIDSIFTRPLPFDISSLLNSDKQFVFDASFRFELEANQDESFVGSNAFITGTHMSFLIQKESAYLLGPLRKNQSGNILQVDLMDFYDYVKANFTTAGKLRKMFEEQQIESYKNDPRWGE